MLPALAVVEMQVEGRKGEQRATRRVVWFLEHSSSFFLNVVPDSVILDMDVSNVVAVFRSQ